MFLNNKYTKWYNSIISNSQSRILHSSIYTEKHHIIPKSLNGTNDLGNIAVLTPREHFVCHLLLTKMVTGTQRRSMWYASYMMCKGAKRYKPTARAYEKLRQNMIAANKERPGPNLGKIFSAETKANMSAASKGKPKGPFTEEHKQNMRKPKPEGFGDKVSAYRTGKSWGHKHSDDTKQKMSDWQKGVPKENIVCEFCSKSMPLMNHKMWHGDKCKSNPNRILTAGPTMNSTTKNCEHCNRSSNLGSYARWHGDKCKSNPNRDS